MLLLFNAILAVPLKDTPAIVLAFNNLVADPAFPDTVVWTMLGAVLANSVPVNERPYNLNHLSTVI